MIVVSNSSPLITLGRIGHLPLLRDLFGRIHLAGEVFHEVTILGAGRPGAEAVRAADWIEVHPPASPPALAAARQEHSLGAGEVGTVLLARAIAADLAIVDERIARRFAHDQGLKVMGCVGILEISYRRGLVKDLRSIYAQLLAQGIHIDRNLLNQSLASLKLPPL